MMRLRDGQRRSFQAPVDVHTAQDGHTYLFGIEEGASEESSNEDQENIELRPRVRECQWANAKGEKGDCMVLLVREAVDGDNLNKLALQYGCTVADLKRVNNLIREQDFFALKSIKIPIKKHSLLSEGNEEAKCQHTTTRESSDCLETFATDDSEMAFNEYFKEMDKDLEKIIQSTDNLEEVIYPKAANTLLPSPASAKERHHGADWGIGWWNAVVIMLLVGIILPVFYVVYYKMQETDDPENPPTLPATNKWQNTSFATPA